MDRFSAVGFVKPNIGSHAKKYNFIIIKTLNCLYMSITFHLFKSIYYKVSHLSPIYGNGGGIIVQLTVSGKSHWNVFKLKCNPVRHSACTAVPLAHT